MTSANRLTSCFAVFLVAVAMMIFSPIRVAEAAVLECWPDQDMDGYGDGSQPTFEPVGPFCDTAQQESDNNLDCDDTHDTVYPGAEEIPADGIDQDCDTNETCYADDDGDHWGGFELLVSDDLDCNDFGEASNDADCDDTDNKNFPGNPEICDAQDNNCDGQVDEGACLDTDGDGLSDDIDTDDDNDGVPDVADSDPVNPDICRDQDYDTCDDCSIGTDDFGPAPDDNPFNDGTDADDDGLCDAGDLDADGDGVANVDEQPGDTDQDDVEDWLDPDDDGDGVLTIDEDPNGNGDPLDDDTDGDNMPNYLDMDDDDDGVPTIDEDRNGDGNPANDDFDGDGVPDYLDPDQAPDLIFEDGFEA